jgi:hypothetical protein
MHVQVACEALQSKRRLEIRYDGYSRVVEAHAVGYSADGTPLMRVWQVRGGSASGERVGWKLLRLDEARGLALIDEPSEAPKHGYKRGDSAMTRITCQI